MNTGKNPTMVYCPIMRQSFTDFPAIEGDLVEYAEIMVSDSVTTCHFVMQFLSGSERAVAPNSIRPEGTKRMLIFGKGTDNLDVINSETDSYFIRCTLSPGATINYYSITENEGET